MYGVGLGSGAPGVAIAGGGQSELEASRWAPTALAQPALRAMTASNASSFIPAWKL
jgi:hypothetical protein